MDAAWEAEAKLSLHVERRFLEWNSQRRAVADDQLPFVQCNYVFLFFRQHLQMKSTNAARSFNYVR